MAGLATGESITIPDKKLVDAGVAVINKRASRVDVEQKEVYLSDGDCVPYDKLILGTGADPVAPPIEGKYLEGVFTLRTLADAQKIKRFIEKKQASKLVFVGSGFISLEVASLLLASRPDVYDITVVEFLDHPLPLMLDADFGNKIRDSLSEYGFTMKMGQKAEKILGSNGRVEQVELDSGEKIDADVVFLNVGAKPNVELAEDIGLKMGKFGIQVNQYLETSNPDILAAGDCIEQLHFITKKPSPIQLRGTAVIQGRLAAKRLAGFEIGFKGVLGNSAVKLFNKSIAATGLSEEQAKKEGIETVSGVVDSRSKHGMIAGCKLWTIKLVFNKKNEKLVGGQIISDAEAPAKEIDTVNALILGEKTISDITMLMCAGNPDCSSEPSLEPIAIAAEQALKKLKK